jgi:hypothetical protein
VAQGSEHLCADSAVLLCLVSVCCCAVPAAARADYAESEKLIAEQLTGLQRDAAWTKSYMVSALLLTKECMQVRLLHTTWVVVAL